MANCQVNVDCPDGLAGFKRGIQDATNELRLMQTALSMIEADNMMRPAQNYVEIAAAKWKLVSDLRVNEICTMNHLKCGESLYEEGVALSD